MSSARFREVAARLREYGGEVVARERDGVVFGFPDGWRTKVFNRVERRGVASILRDAQVRYGHRRSGWSPVDGRKVSGHPRLDLERVSASAHAKERLRLMQGQAAVDLRDVLYALRLPVRVLWSSSHESWVWVGAKVAVPLAFSADGSAVIKTVLWADEEAWVSYPRPDGNV